jgi:cytochrome oxidase Cu insertion factor (SCO1/SenC/PrrC family)
LASRDSCVGLSIMLPDDPAPPRRRSRRPAAVRGARGALLGVLFGLFPGGPTILPPAFGHQAAPLPGLDFVPPPAGSYTLQRIMAAPDGAVLGLDGRTRRLAKFTRGAITLLGFIYTTCRDPDGCPLAYRVFDTLKQQILATPKLHGQLRFVTLSFDPARDPPEVMRRYAGSRVNDAGGPLPWYFLTTRSARELLPLIDGFGQDLRYVIDPASRQPRRELAHVLKVFLIDRDGFVREIYSSAFLHPETVLNDIETLLIEDARSPRTAP